MPLRVTKRVTLYSYVPVTDTGEEYKTGAQRAKRKGTELHGGGGGVPLITAPDRVTA